MDVSYQGSIVAALHTTCHVGYMCLAAVLWQYGCGVSCACAFGPAGFGLVIEFGKLRFSLGTNDTALALHLP